MTRTTAAGLVAFGLAATAAPALAASELDEIRDTQKKILERLDAQDKKLNDILQKVQAPRGPAQPDPNQVFDLPVAKSPVKGPKTAKVALVEFSDFQ